jgi:glycine oxidase
MSPDGHPIVGPDPVDPRVLYACGHSRNGVLMAPGTAGLIADVLSGVTGRVTDALSISRFDIQDRRAAAAG